MKKGTGNRTAPLLMATAVLAGLILILGSGPIWAKGGGSKYKGGVSKYKGGGSKCKGGGCKLKVTMEADVAEVNCVSDDVVDAVCGDCIVICNDTGTDGVSKCVAEEVVYTIKVKNKGSALKDVFVYNDCLNFEAVIDKLLPHDTATFRIANVCLCDPNCETNVVYASAFSGKTQCVAQADASVVTDFVCTDTGTDGY